MGAQQQIRWGRPGQRGQVSPLVALVVVAAVGVAMVVAQLGLVVRDRARARTAADAAALAGVTGGRAAADAVAAADHGVVQRFVVADGATEVTVRVGRAVATARARPGRVSRSIRGPGPSGAPGFGVARSGTDPLRSMLSRAGL